MKKLNQAMIKQIEAELKGERLARFKLACRYLNECLEAGAWVKPKAKVDKGFSGLYKVEVKNPYPVGSAKFDASLAVEVALQFGTWAGKNEPAAGTAALMKYAGLTFSERFVTAWVSLVQEKEAAIKLLDEARPLTKVRPVRLTQKAKNILAATGLKLDVKTVRVARLGRRQVRSHGELTGVTVPVWERGTMHKRSLHASKPGCCEVCGRTVHPNDAAEKLYVPLVAYDRTTGKLVSVWSDRDCARKIFGIDDTGIKRSDP